MCGLAGFIDSSVKRSDSDWGQLLMRMGSEIRHRGPDDSGSWYDINTGIGLVHRRLSIVDLSSAGHQPMLSLSDPTSSRLGCTIAIS